MRRQAAHRLDDRAGPRRPAGLDVVVSTEDAEIAEVAAGRTAPLVPFLRPAELAQDTTPTEPVVRHAIAVARRPTPRPTG